MPMRLPAERKPVATPLMSAGQSLLNKRYRPRTITGGVRITASAKLNSSAKGRSIPRQSAVEIVAPEREKPRKGKHNP